MKILHVTPISSGILPEEISYYTSREIANNFLVQAPFRRGNIFGLVTRSENVSERKSHIKSSSFTLKKVAEVRKPIFTENFLSATEQTAQYYTSPVGGVIASLISKKILQEYFSRHGLDITSVKENGGTAKKMSLHEKYIVQADDEERFSTYRGLIREEFARGRSVFCTTAGSATAEKIFSELSRGIGQYAFLFSAKLRPKEAKERFLASTKMAHPVLIVSTPIFLSIPRNDYGLFIIEEEANESYRTMSRPFFDTRFFIEKYAESAEARLLFGDSYLRVETFARYEAGEISAFTPPRFRSISHLRQGLIDTRAEKNDYSTKKVPFRIMSEKLETELRKTLHDGKNVFLFTVRRGLFPLTVCEDCGKIVSCPDCSSPSVVHRDGEQRFFACHKCRKQRSASETCAYCESWRLRPSGIGVEQAKEEAVRLFPNTEIFEIHRDAIKTEKQTRATIEQFENTPGSILLGTEKALPYIHTTSLAAVLSLDSLFMLPDFRIQERIFHALFEIRNKATDSFFIQTRRPEEPLFTAFLRGDSLHFYREEVKMRQTLHYPPASVLIKIAFEGQEKEIEIEKVHLEKLLSRWKPVAFPAFVGKIKNKLRINVVMKIHKGSWPDSELTKILRTLPQTFLVKVDPEDLL